MIAGCTGSPLNEISSALSDDLPAGRRSPAMHLNKHDLPLCGGPSTKVKEPASKRADTSWSMCLSR